MRLALTGGIGSGKTTALEMFAARGAATLNSDTVVHGLLQSSELRDRIADELGISRFPGDREGRGRLAEAVFNDPARLARLQLIIFPLVRNEVEEWLLSDETARAGLAVVELPMLHEADMEDLFDYVVLITAPQEIRRNRQSRVISASQFDLRAAQQLSEEEKRRRCHLFFENNGSTAELAEFVAAAVSAALSGNVDPRCDPNQ